MYDIKKTTNNFNSLHQDPNQGRSQLLSYNMFSSCLSSSHLPIHQYAPPSPFSALLNSLLAGFYLHSNHLVCEFYSGDKFKYTGTIKPNNG